jgi:Enoyl-CoA hydratase/carnithine racemase
MSRRPWSSSRSRDDRDPEPTQSLERGQRRDDRRGRRRPEQADNNPEIRALVITGSGQRAFCAGADLKAVARGEQLTPAGYERFGFAGYVAHFIRKPTIAAVNGFALGGGTEIALASDLVVAGESAAFGLPEVTRGIFAGAGGTFRLPQQLPWKIGLELLFTGDPIDAATAQRHGLVNHVVPDEQVLDTALALAQRIAHNAPLSVQASKRLAYGTVDGRPPAKTTGGRRTTPSPNGSCPQKTPRRGRSHSPRSARLFGTAADSNRTSSRSSNDP